MKSDKLNEFLSSCNNLETLDCYYWKNYVIGEQFEINYNSFQEEVLNEITTNIYTLQPNQANLYFNQLFQTLESVITNKNSKHFPTFSEEAKEDYEHGWNHLQLEYYETENLDNDIENLLNTNFKEIIIDIIKKRIIKRTNLVYSLKSKITEIKSIYFDGVSQENKISVEVTDNNSKNTDIDELIEIKENISLIIKDKVKWKGKPSQFGYLMIELIGKGWIELPTKSLNKSAEFLLNLFEVDTTKGNLSNEINPEKNSLTVNNEGFFRLSKNNKQ